MQRGTRLLPLTALIIVITPISNYINQAPHKSFILLSTYFRGIKPKAESFVNLISEEAPNFITGTESWLNPSVFSIPLTIKYSRADGYGGVFFSCLTKFDCNQIDISTPCGAIACKIYLSKDEQL